MASRLEARLRKLEAVHGTHPLEQLEPDELTALLIVAEAAGPESATPEITSELLAKHKMSREVFEKASEALTPAFWDRVARWFGCKEAA
jgi:hypothetical protein